MQEKFGNIYKIVSPSGRIYIGQTFNLNRRLNDYAKGRCKSQKRLSASFSKYGFDAHSFEILYGGFCTPAELTEFETRFIQEHDSAGQNGLNVLKSGALYSGTQQKGVRTVTPETREKISSAKKGKVLSNFAKLKISINNSMRNPEHVKTMRDAMMVAINTPECLNKRSESLKKRYAEHGHNRSKKVHQLSIDGDFIAEFPSTMEAARQLKTSDGRISDCCRGERKTHRGFRFVYA